jgi:hypothetical protein
VPRARTPRWLCAVLLAPIALLAVSASSFSALRCTMSGLLMPESCCPTAGVAARAPEPPRPDAARPPACCERIVVANAKAPGASASRADAGTMAAAPLLAAVPVGPAPPALDPAPADLPLRPPGRSAPVFLLTRSFLI